jgi:hypothetical protein
MWTLLLSGKTTPNSPIISLTSSHTKVNPAIMQIYSFDTLY